MASLNADLAGALRTRHKHDIHDPNSTDKETYGCHRAAAAAIRVVPVSIDAISFMSMDIKVVVVARREMATALSSAGIWHEEG